MQTQITLLNLLKVDPNISVIIKSDKLKEMKDIIKLRFNSIESFSRLMGFGQNLLYTWISGNKKEYY